MGYKKTHLVDISPDDGSRGKAVFIRLANMEDAIKRALGSPLFVLDAIAGEAAPNGIKVFKATRYDKQGRIIEPSYVVACALVNPETKRLESNGRLVELATR